jgi:hypothetical protein
MYIHHNSSELTSTIYSEDTNFCRFRRCTNIYGYNGWRSTQGTCKVKLVAFWWRKKICRNRIRVVPLLCDVRPCHYLIGSRRFETRKWSHLQGSKCPRQRIFWPLQIWPLCRHCTTSHNNGGLTYTAATAWKVRGLWVNFFCVPLVWLSQCRMYIANMAVWCSARKG